MDSVDYHAALNALAWQVELGVESCIQDTPLNRYEISKAAPPTENRPTEDPAIRSVPETDPVVAAKHAAKEASDLEQLRAALAAYPYCELRKGARNLVFCDGVPGARVMIIGEAPGRDEDREGRPFVGRAGQLLDKMLAAIDLSRAETVYITNVLPWRPPQNRDPRPDEIAMMQPFLLRHITLAEPDILVVMGNHACQALLGKRGITRLRGTWTKACDRPALPMFHPAYLLRNPAAKRDAWADLLALKARLKDG